MNVKQIRNLITLNSPEQLEKYFGLCYEQLKELNKRCQQITFFGLICIVVYFLSLNVKNLEIDMGFFKINDLAFIVKLLPLVFSYLLWEWALTDAHRVGVRQTVATIGKTMLKTPNDDLEQPLQYNPYLKDMLPFSVTNEMFSLGMGKSVWSAILVLLVILMINTIPISFLFYSIERAFSIYGWNFWNIIFNGLAIAFFLMSYYYQAVKFTRNHLKD
ncbi:hypothetical protein ACFJIV_12675 [Mucilaginibacter sp. UC70_90]